MINAVPTSATQKYAPDDILSEFQTDKSAGNPRQPYGLFLRPARVVRHECIRYPASMVNPM